MDDSPDELRILDPSRLTYPEWIRFFFDRPIHDKAFWDEIAHYDEWSEISEPARIVHHLQTLCLEHTAIREGYSEEQVEQGLWAIFSTYTYQRTLFDPGVDVKLRIRCIESMYRVYTDVVAHLGGDGKDTVYWMWWDYISHEVWAHDYKEPALSPDRQQILEAVMRTLVRILELPYRNCQWAALHGLGHARHPKVREIVQQYLDEHGAELSDEDRIWVEACREGRVL